MDFHESGPVDILLLRFPGSGYRSEIGRALGDLASTGLARVVDVLFVSRSADGALASVDLGGLRAELEPHFAGLEGQLGGGLLDHEDVDEVAPTIDRDASVAVVVVENRWVLPFITAVRGAGGDVVDRARMLPPLSAPYGGSTTRPAGGR